jgi:FKBP-type peptidyl-prolyl cis-trans isomerase FklB
MKSLSLSIFIMALLAGNCLAGETVDLSSKDAKIGYSIGYQIGGDLKMQKIDVRQAMLVKGILDALAGEAALMTEEQMRAALVELKKRADASK